MNDPGRPGRPVAYMSSSRSAAVSAPVTFALFCESQIMPRPIRSIRRRSIRPARHRRRAERCHCSALLCYNVCFIVCRSCGPDNAARQAGTRSYVRARLPVAFLLRRWAGGTGLWRDIRRSIFLCGAAGGILFDHPILGSAMYDLRASGFLLSDPDARQSIGVLLSRRKANAKHADGED